MAARNDGTIGIGLSGRAVVDGLEVPALGIGLSAQLAGPSWARWSFDAGYTFRSYIPELLNVHAVPVGVAARLVADTQNPIGFSVGVRAGATMTFASTAPATRANAAAKTAFGATAGIGPVLRVDSSLTDEVAVFGEIAAEARVVRQAWRVERGRIEEPLVAMPVALGLEWRW